MPFAALLTMLALVTSTPVAAPALAPAAQAPRTPALPLALQQLRACRNARLAVGIPLESPPGTLSDIARIDVLSSLKVARPLGLIYALRNGREFFTLADGGLADPAVVAATNDFLQYGTFDAKPGGVDRDSGGYGIDPIAVDNRRLAPLGLDRRNCASIRVL